MAEYLHPGVYIEEKSFRSPPIEGVSTSTAGLVGRTRKGPEGKPTLVTSFTEFGRTFGEPFPINAAIPPQLGDYLGHAVRAFFDNGGKRVYIVRTLAVDAAASSVGLATGQVYRLAGTTTVRGPTTTLPLVSVRGLDVGAILDVYSRAPDGTTTLRFPITISAVDVARSAVTLAGTGLPAGVTLPNGGTFFLPSGTTLLHDAVEHHGLGLVAGVPTRGRRRGMGGEHVRCGREAGPMPPGRANDLGGLERDLRHGRPPAGRSSTRCPVPGQCDHQQIARLARTCGVSARPSTAVIRAARGNSGSTWTSAEPHSPYRASTSIWSLPQSLLFRDAVKRLDTRGNR